MGSKAEFNEISFRGGGGGTPGGFSTTTLIFEVVVPPLPVKCFARFPHKEHFLYLVHSRTEIQMGIRGIRIKYKQNLRFRKSGRAPSAHAFLFLFCAPAACISFIDPFVAYMRCDLPPVSFSFHFWHSCGVQFPFTFPFCLRPKTGSIF